MIGSAIHPGRKFSWIARAIHLGRLVPSEGSVGYVTCLDEAISAASRQGTVNTEAVARYPCLDELHEGTAAGINALRRLKIKRCGELALRLSSRLTFAYLCVAIRAIHSSRCISAELLVYFIQAGIFSEVVRANLTVNMPLQIRVGVPRLSGDAEMRGPARGTMPTSICGSVSTVRFA